MNPDIISPNGSVPATGFRLLRLEILNWGTFHEKIWTVEPKGGMALLTGANGSGKSTLVDALVTLLVPRRNRNYNQASGAERRDERDDKSYVQGAYGRQRDEQSNIGRVQYLRDARSKHRTPSTLLAVFVNEALQEYVTLAQVFWFQEEGLKKIHIVYEGELSIAEHLEFNGNSTEFKKRMRTLKAETFDEFNRYCERFRKLFGLRSDKALDLFSQIVSIKEIGGLTRFIRDHMLEDGDEQNQIAGLRDNFDNLNQAHETMVKAEQQRNTLRPIIADADKYNDLQRRIHEAERGAAVVPFFFAWHKRRLLEDIKVDTLSEIEGFLVHQSTVTQELETLRQEQIDIEVALRNDATEQRIYQLEQDIIAQTKIRDLKHSRAAQYSLLTKNIGWKEYNDEAAFIENLQKLEPARRAVDEGLRKVDQRRLSAMRDQETLKEECTRIEERIESLKRHKSRIPPEQLRIREELTLALKIPDTDLPFIGELLQIRPDEQDWEGAIERLLNSYGRQMVVPEAHYRRVSAYVNDHNLRGRLVYLRIARQTSKATSRNIHEERIYNKLEVKPDTNYYDWLQADLASRFDHVCCDTMEEFHRETRAITRAGQIKTGGDRHEKDDRTVITDRRFFILGWDNKDQLEDYQAELIDKQKQQKRLQQETREAEQERDTWTQRDNAIRTLEQLKDFNEMHWRAEQETIERLQAEKIDLEKRSDASRHLRERLGDIKDRISEMSGEERYLAHEITRRNTLIDTYDRDMRILETRLAQAPEDFETQSERIQNELKNRTITLEQIDELRDQLADTLLRRQKNYEGQRNLLGENLVKRMADFRRDHPQVTEDLDASIEALPGYADLLHQIEREDLPRHRQRFKELLNEKILTNITIFDSSLKRREEEIKQSIDNLNRALRRIEYTPSTYIRLGHEATDDKEVREFRNMLRACYVNVDPRNADSIEDGFRQIRALIIRFQTEERWAKKVTDVRNWMTFSASERYVENDEEKSYYTDSSGKSGGQKAKLAYTILASAIAYQYGLGQDEDQIRSFRFVVVDEAFSKSDESNSRYAMELFKQLGLQLLVVTPLDKTHITESYISACLFVTNNQDENDSKVFNLPIERYRELITQLSAEEKHDNT